MTASEFEVCYHQSNFIVLHMTATSFSAPIIKFISTGYHRVAIGTLLLMAVGTSHATLFFTEQFNYTDGANLGATSGGGGTTWSVASGDVSVSTVILKFLKIQFSPSAGNYIFIPFHIWKSGCQQIPDRPAL